MRKDNTNNYQTPYSRIQHFKDFVNKERAEKDELGEIERSYIDEPNYDLPHKFKSKYNKVSHKYDSSTEEETRGRKKQIQQDFPQDKGVPLKVVDDAINPNHFFKNNTDVVEPTKLKNFESFVSFLVNNPQVPQTNRNLNDSPSPQEKDDYQGCGCCDDCTGESDCHCCDDCECGEMEDEMETIMDMLDGGDYEEDEDDCGCDDDDCGCDDEEEYSHEGSSSYMFFGNIETIHRYAEAILDCDLDEVDDLLSNGHNWAETHISTAKETLSHVYNFLTNKSDYEEKVKESKKHNNYMFFANLENMVRFCEDILDMDEEEVDKLLNNGHDWAEDHVAAALENVQQVYDWLYTEAN